MANDDDKIVDSQSGHKSFSQSGEDLIMDFVLKNHYTTEKPLYLDIGAYDPKVFSNTYLFYQRGSSGVLVEPDPDLARNIRQERPNDTVLNIGVSKKAGLQDFYLVNPATLNTFSKKEFEQHKLFYPGTQLREVVKTKTEPVNKILETHFKNGLDILSLDVEGLDYQILSSLDFAKHRPNIICVETVHYKSGNTLIKPRDIASLLYKNSYFLYADTFINSIFVDRKKWMSSGQPKLVNFGGYK
jgi:FkbM family methyltransferase